MPSIDSFSAESTLFSPNIYPPCLQWENSKSSLSSDDSKEEMSVEPINRFPFHISKGGHAGVE
jgi:hypothetical protein